MSVGQASKFTLYDQQSRMNGGISILDFNTATTSGIISLLVVMQSFSFLDCSCQLNRPCFLRTFVCLFHHHLNSEHRFLLGRQLLPTPFLCASVGYARPILVTGGHPHVVEDGDSAPRIIRVPRSIDTELYTQLIRKSPNCIPVATGC